MTTSLTGGKWEPRLRPGVEATPEALAALARARDMRERGYAMRRDPRALREAVALMAVVLEEPAVPRR